MESKAQATAGMQRAPRQEQAVSSQQKVQWTGTGIAAPQVNRWFLIVVAVALVAYARSFTAAFQFDDHGQILQARVLHDPTWGEFLFWGRTRIIPYTTLAINYWVNGEDPFWYHVVNFAVHLLTCFAVYRLALALCRTPRLRTTWLAAQAPVFALAAAILFAVHPLQVQAVTYIVQRMSSMAGLFYVSAVLGYVQCRNSETTADGGRPRLAYARALGFAAAAALSKENTASLPLAVLLVEWAFFRSAASRMRFLRRWVPFLLLALMMPIIFWALDRRPAPLRPVAAATPGAPPHNAAARTTPESQQPAAENDVLIQRGEEFAATLQRAASATAISPWNYFLTQCRVLPRYLGLALLPWGFNVDHDIAVEKGLSPAALIGLGSLLVLLVFGFRVVPQWPVIGFGVLWFFIAHTVESTLIPIRDVMNEHRMYLAMPGVVLIAAELLARWHRRSPRLAVIGASLSVLLLTAATMQRNEVWQTELSLWQDALTKSPHKSRVHLNVGTALFAAGNPEEALEHYCTVLRLDATDRFAEDYIQLALSQLMVEGKVELEMANTGPDGVVELVPRHPCPREQKAATADEK